jgi:uncharacterized protein YgiM (DUF1202 family)
MRNGFLILIIVFLFYSSVEAQSETLYIKSLKADLLSEPKAGSDVVGTLQRNDPVEQLGRDKNWIQVKSSSVTGWVSSLFVTKVKSAEKSSVLQTEVDLSQNSRKRASALTSAGAARGLRADSDAIFSKDGVENSSMLQAMEKNYVAPEVGEVFVSQPSQKLAK